MQIIFEKCKQKMRATATCRFREGSASNLPNTADVAVPIGGNIAIPVGRAAIDNILIVEIFEIISRRRGAGVAVHFAYINSI
ncbi:MAG: hypothetical protein ACREOI_01850 [bacterium]